MTLNKKICLKRVFAVIYSGTLRENGFSKSDRRDEDLSTVSTMLEYNALFVITLSDISFLIIYKRATHVPPYLA